MSEPETCFNVTLMASLPIDNLLPDLRVALAQNPAAVLQAAPGAGKTTRVPLALLGESWLEGRSILMLQPRRLAARHAAEFMASQLGESAGKTVGYTVRFERKKSRDTRIEVVTEGILTRRLQTDPELSGVGLVIFDEFHERNLHSDLALALCRDAQGALRDDLKLLVMSATLDAEPVAALLDDCPILTSQGRSFPVSTVFCPQPDRVRIDEAVAVAVRRALKETDGDILAFLPGAGEIQRCAGHLNDLEGIDVRPLYGGLPFEEQRQAIEPGARRRVVLSTNIAETSLTINGITTVVDSGWERRPRFDVGAGVSRLELKRISAASATQRQGRAGRLGPGVCYRLWSEGQQAEFLPQAPPEIRTADLSSLLLELACWGETTPERLAWLDSPPPGSLASARRLLQQLGALDDTGRRTGLGRAMVRLPLEPRLARLVLSAQEDNMAPLACDLAALLSERDLQARGETTTRADCDLEGRWQILKRGNRPGVRSVKRVAEDLKRSMNVAEPSDWPADATRLHRWLAMAWPDRIGRRREKGSERYQLSDGRGAVLSNRSGLDRPEFLVALEVRQRGDQTEIVLASTLERSSLEDVFADRLTPRRQVRWDSAEERIVAEEVVGVGALILNSRPVKATPEEQVVGVMGGIRALGLERLHWTPEAHQFIGRVRHCAGCQPEIGWPDLSHAALMDSLEDWLAPFLKGVTTRSALERFNPLEALKTLVPWELQRKMDQWVPERIQVPSGSKVRVDYGGEGPPVLAAKLQELFGWEQGPVLVEGRLPVQIHLLSPARRPLAVTQDLKNFWDSIYPEVRKEMRGRYPKHPWPEDPWNAPATARTKKRMS